MHKRYPHLRIIFLVLAWASIAAGQSAGTFTATGNMTMSRTNHTATLLLDGRVLITGGGSYPAATPGVPAAAPNRLVTAEIYDPAMRTFTPVGNMTTGRSSHTATLLPDGRVLIAGGDSDLPGYPDDPPMNTTAELYDPSTQTFTATGSMVTGRANFNATLLANGKVLITGGVTRFTGSGLFVGDAELYDPSSGAFTPTGPYAGTLNNLVDGVDGFDSTSTLLADGTVLFATEPQSQVYDPVTGTFSLSGTLVVTLPFTTTSTVIPSYIAGRTASLLMNGKVLAAGGEQEDLGRFTSTELFDPATGDFSFTGDMTVARDGHTATLLPDGTVLMAGGESQTCSGNGCWFSGSDGTAELYDPAKGAFATAGSMTQPREWQTATLLNNGDVLIAGGLEYGGIGIFNGSFATAELYHPASPVPAPSLFSILGDGQGQGAIWHAETGLIASSQTPAVAGEVLSMYTNNLANGGVIPPQVSVGGQLGGAVYFGPAPGYPGYFQVNFQVPPGAAAGSTVPVRLTYLGRSSNAVTIGVN